MQKVITSLKSSNNRKAISNRFSKKEKQYLFYKNFKTLFKTHKQQFFWHVRF